MLQLPSMKYPNTQRTVSGVVDVFPDDVVLNCNTSTGAVTINLAEIPYNATSGQGFWSTQYKLYINDISNNAGTNNITVVAGTGQTLNNQPTLVLNTNGASCYIMIAGNTEYSMFYAPAQAIPANFITVTYAQLSALIAGDDLIAGAFYNVSDAEFGSTPIIPTNIYIQALTTNTVSMTGQGYFYNADYQGVGNYSGVTGFTSQLGIWNPFLVTPIGSVVIWDNFQYVNITGVNIASNPKTDSVNWQLLAYSPTNGYISDISFISYLVDNNRILSRADNFGNFVERSVITARNALNFFKWGSVDVKQNNVSRTSLLYNCNTATAGLFSFFGNTFYGSEVIIGNGTLEGGSITEWAFNTIEKSNISIPKSGGELVNNKFDRFSMSGANTGAFTGNTVVNCGLAGLINTGTISNNVFNNLRTFTITRNNERINQNEAIFGRFEIITVNDGIIEFNFLDYGEISVDTNTATGIIQYNVLTNDSLLALTTNEGEVSNNNLDGFSQLTITLNQSTGIVKNFNITNQSRVQLAVVGTLIGGGNKSVGVNVSNGSVLSIGAFTPATPTFYANTITNGSEVNIQTYSGASFFTFNTLDSTEFNTTNLNGKNVNNNFFKQVNFGGVLPTIPFPLSVIGATAMAGNSTVALELDCSNPAIYDLPTQTLTISNTIGSFGGIYKLLNAGGVTIAKIVGLNSNWVTEFYTDSGITTFQGVSIVGALVREIVSSSGAVAFNITTYTTPLTHDSMFLINVDDLVVVRNTNILV